MGRKNKPFMGHRSFLDELLDKPCKIHNAEGATQTHSLRACWILRQVAKSGEGLLAPNNQPNSTSMVSTVFETFASNNMRKRTLCSLAEVYQVATANPWSDTAITFNSSDEPNSEQLEHQPH